MQTQTVAVGRTRCNREKQADTGSYSRQTQAVAVGRIRQLQ